MKRDKKKPFELPHVMIILIFIMLLVTVMSFFIPSGQFVRDANGVVDPTQFSYIENEPPFAFLTFSMPFLTELWSRSTSSSPSW